MTFWIGLNMISSFIYKSFVFVLQKPFVFINITAKIINFSLLSGTIFYEKEIQYGLSI